MDYEQAGVVLTVVITSIGGAVGALKKYGLLHFGRKVNGNGNGKCPDPKCNSLVEKTHDQVIELATKYDSVEKATATLKVDVKEILSSVGYIEGWVKGQNK